MAIGNTRGVSIKVKDQPELLVPKSLIDPRYFNPAYKPGDTRLKAENMTTGERAQYTQSLHKWYLTFITTGDGAEMIGEGGFFVPVKGGSTGNTRKDTALTATAADKFLSASAADRIKMLSNLTPADKAILMGDGESRAALIAALTASRK